MRRFNLLAHFSKVFAILFAITGLVASANSYNTLDRLKTAENGAIGSNPIAQLKLGWTFDATGNRKTESRAIGAATPVITNLTMDAASNKLSQVATFARIYDAAGNTINDGAIQSLYSARNRLMQVNKAGVQANYSYNAFGERVSKLVSGQTTEFVYDESGHLLGEYRATDATEFVWLDDTPLAVIKPSASTQGGLSAGSFKVYFVQPDHLDTPRVVVNAANQPVWRLDSAPFGDTAANEQPTASLAAFQFNLRFPGQQFDAETGTHYNYFRDYEVGIGRYLQSDPIGLIAGANLFDYVGNKPLNRRDDFGLIAVPPGLLIPTAVKRPSFGPKTDAVLATRSGGSCELCKEGFGAPGSGKGPERHHVPGNEWAPMRDAALLLICATPDLGLQKILVKALRAAFRDPNGLKVLCENCHDDSHGNERRYGN